MNESPKYSGEWEILNRPNPGDRPIFFQAVFPINDCGWNFIKDEIIEMPIAPSCRDISLKVAEELKNADAVATAIDITGDVEVVISCRIGDYVMEWQMNKEKDISVMVDDPKGKMSFYHMRIYDMKQFIQKLKNGEI